MKLLLDTHVALWALTNHPNLSARARTLIGDPENEIFVSAAAIWEIAIKHAVGRVPDPIPMSGKEALDAFRDAGYQVIDTHPLTSSRWRPFHRCIGIRSTGSWWCRRSTRRCGC